MELEPAPHQATDLSGDAGAVGRWIISGQGGRLRFMTCVTSCHEGVVPPCRGRALVPLHCSVYTVLVFFCQHGLEDAKVQPALYLTKT